MSIIGRIFVKLGLDDKQFQSGMNQAEQSTDRFGGVIKKLGSALAVAFSVRAVVNFAKESIAAYNKQAVAIAKLESVLKSTGNAAGLTSKELQRYASELQAATTFGDEVTLDAMARLATFKSISKDIFKNTIASAQDLATVMGTDLNSAVLQLGKALETPELGLTMLRRSGVSFTNEQIEGVKKLLAEGKKQEAQLVILAEVQSQFGGAAKAAADTAGGAWKQVANAFDDLKEAIGQASESTKGFANNLSSTLTYINLILSTENVGLWTKLGTLVGNPASMRKYQEAVKKTLDTQKEAAVFVEKEMKSINNVEDATKRLSTAKFIKTQNYIALTAALEEYIKSNTKEKAAVEGLIPSIQKEIDAKKELRNLETDRGKIRIINDEIAALDLKLRLLQMSTSELKKYNDALLVNRKARDLTLSAAPTFEGKQSPVKSGKDPFKSGDAYGYIVAGLENAADAAKAANDKLKKEEERANQIAQGFQNAFVNVLGNSVEHLTDIIAGTGKLDTKQMVAALLMPLADMAISAGTIILTSGKAITSLVTAMSNPATAPGAIAFGAALVAVGIAAKAGLKALAKGGGGGTQTSGGASFTGGSGGFLPKMDSKPVEVFGKISGADILLSSERAAQLRKR